jgi:hypothetical protein
LSNGAGKPYCELGELLEEFARKRYVRGPYRIGRYVREKTDRGPASGSAWSQIFYGDILPKPETMRAFRDAFELTEDEEARLAYIYTFRGSSKLKQAPLEVA